MTKKLSAFITDGYTEERYIKARDLMYPEVRFEFRPIVSEDQSALMANIRDTSICRMKVEREIAELMSDHLVKWSFDEKITVENLLKMKPALMDRMAGVVLYASSSGDDDPRKDAEEKLKEDKTQQFSASRKNADLGNS